MLIAGVVGIVDARRRNELMLMESLGFGPLMVAGIWMATIFILEIVVRALPIARSGY
jgi:lipopolysaccharide export LptBFGC system permease protein LptF